VGVALVAAGFTWLNRGERVAVDLGIIRFFRAPLTLVAIVAFLAGMLAMMLLSLRHDRRVREELRARGLLEPARPGPVRAAAASAWGVSREPAATREHDARTIGFSGDGAPRTIVHPPAAADERTIGFSGDDGQRTIVHPHEAGERTAAYAGDGDPRTVRHPHDADERTVAYAGDDDQRTIAHPRNEDERTISYPRYDEDPAA
jgi:hypothetical protein